MSDAGDNLDELRAALRADVPGLAEALLGPPNKALSTRNTWRWGNKGSLALEVNGPHKGLWYTHEGGEGNNPLGLIRHVRGGSFPDALAYARKFTGLANDADDDEDQDDRREQREADRQARRAEREAAEAEELAAEQGRRVETAQQIAAGTVPLAGTLGEYYLKQVRGIPASADGWPASIRFHPRNRSLVAIATTADGTVQAVQQVYLTEDGTKAPDAPGRPSKRTNGVTKNNGAMVRLPAQKLGQPASVSGGQPLLLAEGPETGLAAWSSSGHETWVALGGIPKLAPGVGRRVVICRDDDQRYSPADRKLVSAIGEWRRAGVVVAVATPWPSRRYDRSDLADTILAEGPEAVQRRIAAAVEPAAEHVARLPVVEARKVTAEVIGAFFAKVDRLSEQRAEWDRKATLATRANMPSIAEGAPPYVEPSAPEPCASLDDADWGAALDTEPVAAEPVTFTHGVRVDVGVGKSDAARRFTAATLAAMRPREDGRTMVFAVPTHALGDEQALAFLEQEVARAAGLSVALWRGRAAPDPSHPDYHNSLIARANKAPMCGDLERVQDAQAIGLQAQTAVCKRRIKQADGTRTTVTCPLFSKCSYQAQSGRRADLWIMAHEMLFYEKPAAMGEVAAVVVDEAAWRKGLIGAEGGHLTLSLDALAENVESGRLADLRRQLLDVLRPMSDGPIRRAALRGTLLVADSAAEAFKLEYARKVDPLHPGQSREERKDAMERADGNRTIARVAMAWNAIRELLTPGGPEASGWLALGVEKTKDGPVRVLRIKNRKQVTDGFKAPTLLLDALLPAELVRPFWPDLELVADVRAEMPHQHVRQVGYERAYALSMLEPLATEAAEKDPEEARRRRRNLRDLRAFIVREARRYAPGKVLVVLQQAVEQALLDSGTLPPNVETAHHNNIAGRDEWRDVRALIVVGRTMPPPPGVERIAEALTGRATPAPMEWYERADATREMADGSTVPTEADRHTDPIAESARWQIAEGELLQIIGRARGVNRTADNPVDVLVLTDVPLPIPLAGTLEAADLEVTPFDHMLAAGGLVIENPTDAAMAYPFLWLKRESAKKAFQRGKLGTFPYIESSIGECPQPAILSGC